MYRHLVLALGLGLSTACGGGGALSPPSADQPTGIGGAAPDFIAPIRGRPFCDVPGGGGYGYYATERPIDLEDHYGLDLGVGLGTEVIASRAGRVIRAERIEHAGFGYFVILYHGLYAGFHTYTLYAHLSDFDPAVTAGAPVVQGDRLGWSGETGTVTGPVLHFEFIQSATVLPFQLRGPTAVAPNYEQWQDPAFYIAGLEACRGPGGRDVPPRGPPFDPPFDPPSDPPFDPPFDPPPVPDPAPIPDPLPEPREEDPEPAERFEATYLLENGDFENGARDWRLSGDFWADAGDPEARNARRGEGYAAGGVDAWGYAANYADGSMTQTFYVPAGAEEIYVKLYVNVTSQQSDPADADSDRFRATIVDESGAILATICSLSNRDRVSSKTNYARFTRTIRNVGGEWLQIRFVATSDRRLPTVFRIDDVSVLAR